MALFFVVFFFFLLAFFRVQNALHSLMANLVIVISSNRFLGNIFKLFRLTHMEIFSFFVISQNVQESKSHLTIANLKIQSNLDYGNLDNGKNLDYGNFF